MESFTGYEPKSPLRGGAGAIADDATMSAPSAPSAPSVRALDDQAPLTHVAIRVATMDHRGNAQLVEHSTGQPVALSPHSSAKGSPQGSGSSTPRRALAPGSTSGSEYGPGRASILNSPAIAAEPYPTGRAMTLMDQAPPPPPNTTLAVFGSEPAMDAQAESRLRAELTQMQAYIQQQQNAMLEECRNAMMQQTYGFEQAAKEAEGKLGREKGR